MSECYRDSKPSTGAYAPSLRFADKVRGEAALDLVSGELWVCSRHPDGQFVTERKATALDLQAVADLLTQARARIQTLEGALRWLTNICCGVGKRGEDPDCGEPEVAVENAKEALAGPVCAR